jgi:putative endonuclease
VTDDARRHLGQAGELLAAEHLERQGFTVLDRNYRTRWGELDIVAFDGTTLTFCEVKTRTAPFTRGDRAAPPAGSPGPAPTLATPAAGAPLEAIHGRKRGQVRKMAGRWLIERTRRPYADTIRFDAIGVTVDPSGRLMKLEHLEGAF